MHWCTDALMHIWCTQGNIISPKEDAYTVHGKRRSSRASPVRGVSKGPGDPGDVGAEDRVKGSGQGSRNSESDIDSVSEVSWAREVFFVHFFNSKISFFAFFIKLIWLGVGFLNRTCAEIGYYLHKTCKKSFFFIGKIKKYRKCPALEMRHVSLSGSLEDPDQSSALAVFFNFFNNEIWYFWHFP